MVTKQQAYEIAEQTQDAYSYDAYTPAGWRACCLMLAKRGYDAREIEAIMRSKWTRWAGDGDSERRRRFNSKTLEEYLCRQIEYMGSVRMEREISKLVEGTFGL